VIALEVHSEGARWQSSASWCAGRVREIGLAAEPPFVVVPGSAVRLQRFPPEPGDRVGSLAEGVQGRNAAELDVEGALRRRGTTSSRRPTSTGARPRSVSQRLEHRTLRLYGSMVRGAFAAALRCRRNDAGRSSSRIPMRGRPSGE
jgi:hypothetical protein